MVRVRMGFGLPLDPLLGLDGAFPGRNAVSTSPTPRTSTFLLCMAFHFHMFSAKTEYTKLFIKIYSSNCDFFFFFFLTRNNGNMAKRIDVKISNESTLTQNCLALICMGLSNESTRFVRGIMGRSREKRHLTIYCEDIRI